jgi:hypothetical protein
MCLPLLLNSATLPLGERKRFPLMVSMYVLAVVNDLGLAASSRIHGVAAGDLLMF